MTKPSHYDVVLSPVITEKSTLVLEKSNQVVLMVHKNATKPQIKQAVEALFKVKVKTVNTLVRKGKLKAFRGTRALQADTKRAIVTLAPGEAIDISSGI
jgi:large subunit ribosomal protein L23